MEPSRGSGAWELSFITELLDQIPSPNMHSIHCTVHLDRLQEPAYHDFETWSRLKAAIQNRTWPPTDPSVQDQARVTIFVLPNLGYRQYSTQAKDDIERVREAKRDAHERGMVEILLAGYQPPREYWRNG